ncbi:MAG: polymer-forming cytoskeletal protein [Candidatus Gygaella obscura]|nr:polymer-forming cytoskeletal protein [Candidatus Gygaella obscura]
MARKVVEKILDVDASMQGTLSFKDPVNLRINGKFEGNLDTKGSLTIGPNAVVSAHIVGDNILIAGKVKGDVLARQKLILHSTAVLEGKIRTMRLIVEEGARFEGESQMLHDFFSAKELAEYLEIDMSSVTDWATGGKIPGVKDGNSWKFERKAIDDWIAAGKLH